VWHTLGRDQDVAGARSLLLPIYTETELPLQDVENLIFRAMNV
jgi:hypothetical protein